MFPRDQPQRPLYAANLRRLMARGGWTVAGVTQRTGLDARTVKQILNGRRAPQPRTLHRLARGLEVPVDELFQDPSLLAHRLFDRRSNPRVDEAIAEHPRLFHGWTQGEFDELYSRFGTGGALTAEGAVQVAQAMNRRRHVQAKVALLLETGEAELLESFVELLYRRVQVPDDVGLAFEPDERDTSVEFSNTHSAACQPGKADLRG